MITETNSSVLQTGTMTLIVVTVQLTVVLAGGTRVVIFVTSIVPALDPALVNTLTGVMFQDGTVLCTPISKYVLFDQWQSVHMVSGGGCPL